MRLETGDVSSRGLLGEGFGIPFPNGDDFGILRRTPFFVDA